MGLELRAAAPGDGAGMAIVHVAAWQEGYAGLMPAAYLSELDPAARARVWEDRLTRVDDPHQPLADPLAGTESIVAVDDGDLVGIAVIGPDREDSSAPALGELWSLNVRPDVWGRGVGTALLAEATRRLAGRGRTTAVLWVVEGNERARSLYEKHGWVADGTSKVLRIGGAAVTELRYSQLLG